jgi:hypothetical protein
MQIRHPTANPVTPGGGLVGTLLGFVYEGRVWVTMCVMFPVSVFTMKKIMLYASQVSIQDSLLTRRTICNGFKILTSCK